MEQLVPLLEQWQQSLLIRPADIRNGMNPEPLKPELVAPCGMDCNICKAYLAFSRGIAQQRGKVTHCSGCRPHEKNCYVKRGCKKLRKGEVKFCYECADMPCMSISHLEKRYTERYQTSFVANLRMIEA